MSAKGMIGNDQTIAALMGNTVLDPVSMIAAAALAPVQIQRAV